MSVFSLVKVFISESAVPVHCMSTCIPVFFTFTVHGRGFKLLIFHVVMRRETP